MPVTGEACLIRIFLVVQVRRNGSGRNFVVRRFRLYLHRLRGEREYSLIRIISGIRSKGIGNKHIL